jgi:uncharacterized protein YjbI with pentapeptide repeats
MANEEHLEILKQGARHWNRWREENPDLQPDLSKANLRDIKVPNINFKGVNFRWADLSGANLAGSNLDYAALRWATLRAADLNGPPFIEQTSVKRT